MYTIKRRQQPIIFKGSSIKIDDVFSLEKIGAGHDGYVFRYNDKALKVLKYDILTRKTKDLMTFDKAMYFAENMRFHRFASPEDILLDEDGVYCGYSMKFLDDVTLEKKKGTPRYRTTSSFTCGDLIHAFDELESDVENLSKHKIEMRDLNKGSYVFTSDFMQIVDMDKFKRYINSHANVKDKNVSSLNFLIAKFLLMEMKRARGIVTEEQVKILNTWLKRTVNSRHLLNDLSKEIGTNYSMTIGEFAKEKANRILG